MGIVGAMSFSSNGPLVVWVDYEAEYWLSGVNWFQCKVRTLHIHFEPKIPKKP